MMMVHSPNQCIPGDHYKCMDGCFAEFPGVMYVNIIEKQS